MTTSAEAVREIDSAKHRIDTAQAASDFADEMAAQAANRVATEEAQVEDLRARLRAAESQLEKAKSNLEDTRSKAASWKEELKGAKSNLESVEKKHEVIEIEDDAANNPGRVSPNDDIERFGEGTVVKEEGRSSGQEQVPGVDAKSNIELVEQKHEVIEVDGDEAHEPGSVTPNDGIEQSCDVTIVKEEGRRYGQGQVPRFAAAGSGIYDSDTGLYESDVEDNLFAESSYNERGEEVRRPARIGPIVVKEFEVSGGIFGGVNGKYRFEKGKESKSLRGFRQFTSARRTSSLLDKTYVHQSAGGCYALRQYSKSWSIWITKKEKGDVLLYESPAVKEHEEFPPPKVWSGPKSCTKDSDRYICVIPVSGLGENGEEISFHRTVRNDEIEDSRVLVEGCSVQKVNGIYKKGITSNGNPTYFNSQYVICTKQDDRDGRKRWVLSRKSGDTSSNNLAEAPVYQSAPISSESSDIKIPAGPWDHVNGEDSGPNGVFFITPKKEEARESKRQRRN